MTSRWSSTLEVTFIRYCLQTVLYMSHDAFLPITGSILLYKAYVCCQRVVPQFIMTRHHNILDVKEISNGRSRIPQLVTTFWISHKWDICQPLDPGLPKEHLTASCHNILKKSVQLFRTSACCLIYLPSLLDALRARVRQATWDHQN